MRLQKIKFLKIVGRESRNTSIFGRESRIVCVCAGSINQIFQFLKIVGRESGNIPNLVQKVETSMRGRKTKFLKIFGRESRNLSTFGREIRNISIRDRTEKSLKMPVEKVETYLNWFEQSRTLLLLGQETRNIPKFGQKVGT